MLSWKRKKRSSEGEAASVGIAIDADQVVIVAFEGEEEGQPKVLAWESIPYESLAQLEAGLRQFVDAHGLVGRSARCVLAPNDYSLRLVERPANVPDEELVDATRWLVRDLIEFDIETAALAILTVPEANARARTPHMFVIAAQPQPTLDLGDLIETAGLRLAGFEIGESAILALDARMPDVVGAGAVLRLADKASVLTVTHAHHLYLARTLQTDLPTIDQAADQALSEEDPSGPSIIEALDPLLLDVQRSFDYYESEYGKAPASRLTLLPSAVDMTPLVPALSEALRPVQIEIYDLPRFFSFPEPPPAQLHPMLSLAIGGAMARSDLIGDALLPPTMKKPTGGFGLASVARIAAAVAVLLGAYYGFSQYQLDQMNSRLTQIESRRDTLSASIAASLEEAKRNTAILDPEAEIARLTARRDARISMLRDMTQRASRSQSSFSSLLTGLARQDSSAVWLERIEFTKGGDAIALDGRTLEPEQLPVYLRQLGTEPGFSKRTFRRFQVERPEGPESALVFRLATRAESDDGEDQPQ